MIAFMGAGLNQRRTIHRVSTQKNAVMEAKEKNGSSIDKARSVLYQSGLVIVLSLALLAFEWGKDDVVRIDLGPGTSIVPEDDIVMNTKQEKIQPQLQNESFRMIIVEHTDPIDIEWQLIDPEWDPTDVLTPYVPPKYVEDPDDDPVGIGFIKIEDQPSFPGGETERLKFLANNMHYPRLAQETHISGKVYIGFIVEKDGSISNVSILKDIGGGCGEEAARVVKMMPRWSPGKQRDKAVRVTMSMPVEFRLQSQ